MPPHRWPDLHRQQHDTLLCLSGSLSLIIEMSLLTGLCKIIMINKICTYLLSCNIPTILLIQIDVLVHIHLHNVCLSHLLLMYILMHTSTFIYILSMNCCKRTCFYIQCMLRWYQSNKFMKKQLYILYIISIASSTRIYPSPLSH